MTNLIILMSCRSQPLLKRCLSRTITMESQQRGLLSGIGEMKAAQYYSDSISVDKAASLVLDEKRLFNICLENDQGDREKMQATLANARSKCEGVCPLSCSMGPKRADLFSRRDYQKKGYVCMCPCWYKYRQDIGLERFGKTIP